MPGGGWGNLSPVSAVCRRFSGRHAGSVQLPSRERARRRVHCRQDTVRVVKFADGTFPVSSNSLCNQEKEGIF
jgi:hypothetical protein